MKTNALLISTVRTEACGTVYSNTVSNLETLVLNGVRRRVLARKGHYHVSVTIFLPNAIINGLFVIEYETWIR